MNFKYEVFGDEGEQAQNPNKKAFRFLLGYARRETKWIMLGMVMLVVGSGSQLALPYFLGKSVEAMAKQDFEKINELCLYLLLLVVVSAAGGSIRSVIFNSMSERIARNLRKDFYESMVNKDVAFFDEQKAGDLLSRLNSDVQVIQDALSENVSMLLRGSVQMVLVLAIMVYMSKELTGLTVILVCPLTLAWLGVYGRRMRDLTRSQQKTKGDMNNHVEESFSNIRTVKAFSNEINEVQKFEEGNNAAYKIGVKRAIWQGLFGFIGQVTGTIAIVTVVWQAARLVAEGKISLADITSFFFYLLLLIYSFALLTIFFGRIMSLMGASDAIVNLMEHQPLVNSKGGSSLKEQAGVDLELSDVEFSYPARPDVNVLNGISFRVDSRQKRVIALCGKSGCGKSTIMSMLERFYDPTHGTVKFNGVNIRELDPKEYHRQLGIVQQEPVLFSGTIRENIVYGLEHVDQEEIDEAARQANAYDFIHDVESFPAGYDTTVGERGTKLSGGQKQRIAIARALVRKPQVLILDEATSALDAESEYQVQQALENLIQQGQQTIIIVAHRLSTIKSADEIMVVHEGKLAERGTHQHLIELDGLYKNLVSRQLENSAQHQLISN